MKKILALSLVVLLALTACPHNNKIDPNAPLALTVENLAGKWVRESDPTIFYIFNTDYTYKIGSTNGTFSLTETQITLADTDPWGQPTSLTRDLVLYKDYLIMQTIKYIKEK